MIISNIYDYLKWWYINVSLGYVDALLFMNISNSDTSTYHWDTLMHYYLRLSQIVIHQRIPGWCITILLFEVIIWRSIIPYVNVFLSFFFFFFLGGGGGGGEAGGSSHISYIQHFILCNLNISSNVDGRPAMHVAPETPKETEIWKLKESKNS